MPVIRTDVDGKAISPEAAASLPPEVPATNELPAPTMPAAELPLPVQSPQPAAYSPLPEATPEVSYNPADSYQPPAAPAETAPDRAEEWFEDDDFDLDGLGDGPDTADFEGDSTFDQSQGGSNR